MNGMVVTYNAYHYNYLIVNDYHHEHSFLCSRGPKIYDYIRVACGQQIAISDMLLNSASFSLYLTDCTENI